MHFLGLLLLSLAKILHLLVTIYTILIAVAVIISWVNPDPYNPLVRFLAQATGPVLRQVRHWMPRFFFRTGLDFSPILVFILLILIDTLLVGLLFDWSHQLLSK